jgi:lysophospholipase L1-like esterase
MAWRSRLGVAALLAGGVVAALFLLELFLRLYDPFGQRLWGDRIALPTHTRHVLHNRLSPKLDREIVLARNGLGFRGPERPADADRWLSVIAVGGSTTECRFLTEGRDWPAVLGADLGARFDRVWTQNAGLDGHSTYGHALLLRQRVGALRPKVVLLLVGINDVERDDLKSQDRALVDRPDASVLTSLARYSAIAATVQNIGRARRAEHMALDYRELDLAAQPQGESDPTRTERVVRRHRHEYVGPYRDRLRELVALCREAGALPVLLTQPALYGPAVDDVTGVDLARVEVDATRRWDGALAWAVLEAYNDATREVGRETGTRVVDLARDVPKSSRLYYDFVHFTNEGAAVVAHRVADALCPVLAQNFPDHARSAGAVGASPCP